MKKKTASCSTLLHLRILVRSLLPLFSVFLLIPGLSSKANAQADRNRKFPPRNLLVLQEQKVLPGDGGTQSYFGRAVAINGTTALIGAIGDNGFQGAAYLFTKSNGIWSQAQKLTASDGLPGDEFGSSVVLTDHILLVGAPAAAYGASGPGAVYVFRKTGDTWVESQKLIASDGLSGDQFGDAIALSGGTLVVGADDVTIKGQFYQGAAYVFVQSNGIWSQMQKLTGDDSAEFDHFGSAVAVQGSMILIGAPDRNLLIGEVYVFSGSNNSWNQTQSLTVNDNIYFPEFGASLALGSATALVGAPYADGNGHATQGAVYVFGISGGILTQTQKITSNDGASNDAFGSSLALTENLTGARALIGAPDATVGRNKVQGKAYVLRELDGNWGAAVRITASDGVILNYFGAAVALDRETALVGALPAALPQEGAAYFYTVPADNRALTSVP
jgi:hypothetical protein